MTSRTTRSGDLFQRLLKALDSIARGNYFVPFKLEIVAQSSHHVGLVLHDKNLRRGPCLS